MTDKLDDYDVGYGKPPRTTRFRKGQSGNPRGRPKGSRNFTTDLDEILSEPLTITENGKPRKVSSQLAALKRLRAEALQGNPRALDRLLMLAADRSAERDVRSADQSPSAEEAEILERFANDFRRDASLPHAEDET